MNYSLQVLKVGSRIEDGEYLDESCLNIVTKYLNEFIKQKR